MIIDKQMPSRCYDCPCQKDTEMEEPYCGINEKEIDIDIFSTKPKWCPLKEEKEYRMLLNGQNKKGSFMAEIDTIINDMNEAITFVENRGYGGIANTMRCAMELLKKQTTMKPITIRKYQKCYSLKTTKFHKLSALNASEDGLPEDL